MEANLDGDHSLAPRNSLRRSAALYLLTLKEPSGSDIIADFCDASFYKTHPLYKKDPKALQIIAYFDEVEVCNPLGSHASVQKLGEVISFQACKQ